MPVDAHAAREAPASDEPRRHPGYMALLAVVAVATVPFPFIGAPLRFWHGLPTWLWWSMANTLLLSAVTAWGVLRYWRDDALD